MEEKKYLKWYNKIGYGSGDIAGNVVYGGRKKSCVFGSCIFLIKIRYVKFCCRL